MSRFKKSGAIAALVVVLVGGFEGLRTVAYTDSVGIPTLCFGETRNVKLDDTATPEQCKILLAGRLEEFSTAIDQCLPPDLPDATYVAFLSAAYNIGTKAFCSSSMAQRARAGDVIGGCNALTLWDKITIAGRKVALPGLTKRRAEERNLCLSGLGGAS